jgi:hypothetical protein
LVTSSLTTSSVVKVVASSSPRTANWRVAALARVGDNGGACGKLPCRDGFPGQQAGAGQQQRDVVGRRGDAIRQQRMAEGVE